MDEDPIEVWIARLKENDDRAEEIIWEQYFQKLVQLARSRLGTLPRRSDDEEDIALSALNSFFGGVRKNRFPKLEDRDDLWRLMVTITARKASRRHRRFFAAKRGGGAVRGESAFQRNVDDRIAIAEILGREPSPEFALETAETYKELVDQLGSESLREIVVLKLEGYTNVEIAHQLQCATRTVERKLEKIRSRWETATPE